MYACGLTTITLHKSSLRQKLKHGAAWPSHVFVVRIVPRMEAKMDENAAIVLERSETRFQISDDGWARMNAGRDAGDLIREAVSNTFDAEGVTKVFIEIGVGYATIEDNSPSGIGDPRLITTVFMTAKEDSHLLRGRKGRGLKELISAAAWAEVDTIGHRVVFKEGRERYASNRAVGTKVTVKAAQWDKEATDAAVAYLKKIIAPANIKFYLNGTEVAQSKIRSSFACTLNTQIVESGIQRTVYRYTTVNIVNLKKGETEGWLFEMGIPVQRINTKFHVDVQQRIPLNDNRDIVDQYYLNDLYSEILNHNIKSLNKTTLREEWVLRGMPCANHDASIAYVEKMFDEKADKIALKGNDALANDTVKMHGFKLVDLTHLPSGVATNLARVAQSAEVLAKKIEDVTTKDNIDPASVDPTGSFRTIVKYIAKKVIGKDLNINFFSKGMMFTGMYRVAEYNNKTTTMGFNISEGVPFNKPLDAYTISTVIHELTHEYVSDHDNEFLKRFEQISGVVAKLMFDDKDILTGMLNNIPVEPKIIGTLSAKITVINCIDCGRPREVHPQDVFQVKRCKECQKRYSKERAREARRTKA